MKYQIKRFSLHRAGLFVAFVYFIFGLIGAALLAFGLVEKGGFTVSGIGITFTPSKVGAFLIPFLTAIIGYISGILYCFFYNFATRFTGGIEVTLTEIEPGAALNHAPTARDK